MSLRAPTSWKRLPRLRISMPSRSSICRRCASNGPHRLTRRCASSGSSTRSSLAGVADLLMRGPSSADAPATSCHRLGDDHVDELADQRRTAVEIDHAIARRAASHLRSEEHTSELQSLMRISYAVFCLQKNKKTQQTHHFNT